MDTATNEIGICPAVMGMNGAKIKCAHMERAVKGLGDKNAEISRLRGVCRCLARHILLRGEGPTENAVRPVVPAGGPPIGVGGPPLESGRPVKCGPLWCVFVEVGEDPVWCTQECRHYPVCRGVPL
jgi:hypothetical protein